jgi:hypothetical protein
MFDCRGFFQEDLMSTQPERIYFADNKGRKVTAGRLETGRSSFLLKDISSMRIVTSKFHNVRLAVYMMVVGLAFLLFFPGIVWKITGAIIMAIFTIVLLVSKPGYVLKIHIGNKEIDALASSSENHVQKIMAAINQALRDQVSSVQRP